MSKANNLVPLVTVVLSRKIDGVQKRIKPEVGKVFEFTDDEIKDIKAANPDALRKPINESGESASTSETVKTGGEGGKTEKTDLEIAEGTKAVVKGLIGPKFDVQPNMETTNKALKAEGLPEIKADKRDSVIAEIKAESEL